MEERQKLWRARLMGDDETCARKRELYHRFIKGRASQDAVVRQQIRADMPRTFVGVEQVDRANVETLLLSYAAVQQGDGYLQGGLLDAFVASVETFQKQYTGTLICRIHFGYI